MFHFVPHKGVTLEIGLAVIFWPYWLANDFRDFPFTPSRARTQYCSACKFWSKCTGDICVFPFEGAKVSQ
jgi:uncharacterized protein involved in cysteine biosynthesis